MRQLEALFGFWWSGVRELRLTLDVWLVASTVLVLLLICPLLVIAGGIFQPSSEVWGHIRQTVLWRYLGNTLLLLAGTGSVTLLLGTVTAWLVALYRFPGQPIFEWALILPLAVPTYIVAFAYAGMLDYSGPVPTLLSSWAGRPVSPPFEVMSMGGVIFVISFVLYPYVYLLARTSFRHQSGALVEASRMMGKTPLTVFRKVVLPSARPALAAGVGLVLMESLNDYGAVKYYGVDTLTTGIFRAWFSMDDFDAAIRLSAWLMLVAFVVLLLERFQRGRARYQTSGSGAGPTRERLRGTRAVAAILICSIPLFFGFLLPLLQLLYWLGLTFQPSLVSAWLSSIWSTFLLAAVSAVIAVMVAVVVAYTSRMHRHLVMTILSRFATVGYSIPGAVIAVGVLVSLIAVDRSVAAWTRQDPQFSAGLILTGSLAGLTFAYLVRFMAVGYGAVESGFEKLCGRFDEAARSLGLGPLRTLLRVNFPLASPALAGAGLLVFIEVVKELPLTLILRPFNFDTLATKVFELAGDERVPESAFGALVIIGTSLLPILILNRLTTRQKT